MKHYAGIDLGGTYIKGGIVDENGEIVKFGRVPTQAQQSADVVLGDIEGLIEDLLEGFDGKISGIGMGIPGLVDGSSSNVVLAPNLHWKNVPVADRLTKKFGCVTKLSNDANCAGLGEARFGTGAKYKTSVFLTLGTGVGGAIIIDGKLYEGNACAGAEIGHMIIRAGGNRCACGNKGCYETYASASALIRETKKAMQADPASKMWEVGSLDSVGGKTAFDYYEIDLTAKKVVDEYVANLSTGIINIANIFRPEAIILGGGVAKQGKTLTDKVQALLNEGIFAGTLGPKVKVLSASLKEAGVVGAASLNM
ncbi:MAG: ROK family protein [Clostridia bacterium]|nr:ROK family protein [Clostridia bacterium]